MEWQPIETAPIEAFNKDTWWKSPRRLLVFCPPTLISIADYSYTKSGKGRWRNAHGIVTPTHWMPLPEPPAV